MLIKLCWRGMEMPIFCIDGQGKLRLGCAGTCPASASRSGIAGDSGCDQQILVLKL